MVNFNLLENDLSDALWRLTRINEKHTSDIVLGQLRSFEKSSPHVCTTSKPTIYRSSHPQKD